uniref:Cytochrome c oxidase assembly protein COX15 n=1 Tax=Chromera velia CCMP2878 TaxID=1169474 RepID=A0A0G4I6C8_9ALVE|eukprot:Cvel_1884.t1-p1 / transcript=Cvel_1884.t1 / gene=Cvel_1884 / organism=Chromera_velia_CCMP2878 / gene_product=Cytochrome c oxidase assembly protein COX15, putative / transcript_product=Cytochrome c oxidase assembly protein COX15, putative / location=Cvel_scaffold70:95008-96276(-) / protein_length=423 / sequence_SO=supercontig / SO=protein_coding / is_pseudo=false
MFRGQFGRLLCRRLETARDRLSLRAFRPHEKEGSRLVSSPSSSSFSSAAAQPSVPLEFASRLVKPGFERQVGGWLLASGGLIFGMVCVGGYTRLTRSGLSMTDWDFQGKWLPTSKERWEAEFRKYKQTPEFEKIHAEIELDEFKFIYFNEWFHRMFGRGIGIFFGAGLTYFIARSALKGPMFARLAGLFCLGGAQGLIGWWMVKSGLTEETLVNKEDPRVSPYRLTTHLTMATALYAAVMWNAFSLLRKAPTQPLSLPSQLSSVRLLALPVSALALVTFVSGAFVAGNDAGHAYNTWPKMLDHWVPPEWVSAVQSSKIREFFENAAVVQFDHRMLAYSTVLATTALALFARSRGSLPSYLVNAASVPAAAAWVQMGLGIATLMMYVPVKLGVAHQAGGLSLVTAVVWMLHVLLKQPVGIVRPV